MGWKRYTEEEENDLRLVAAAELYAKEIRRIVTAKLSRHRSVSTVSGDIAMYKYFYSFCLSDAPIEKVKDKVYDIFNSTPELKLSYAEKFRKNRAKNTSKEGVSEPVSKGWETVTGKIESALSQVRVGESRLETAEKRAKL